tara:strand:+ start:444 stop:680 length:237 start_codon:yes stop_codon:yes gene_type:complete
LINLIYIRAAIRERTGRELTLEAVRDYLLQEKLITPAEAADENLIFRGYDEFFETDEASTRIESIEYLIEKEASDEDE